MQQAPGQAVVAQFLREAEPKPTVPLLVSILFMILAFVVGCLAKSPVPMVTGILTILCHGVGLVICYNEKDTLSSTATAFEPPNRSTPKTFIGIGLFSCVISLITYIAFVLVEEGSKNEPEVRCFITLPMIFIAIGSGSMGYARCSSFFGDFFKSSLAMSSNYSHLHYRNQRNDQVYQTSDDNPPAYNPFLNSHMPLHGQHFYDPHNPHNMHPFPSAPPDDNYIPPPSHDPPSYDPPSYDPPSYDPPSYDPPSYDPPSYDPPSYDPPATSYD